MSLASVADDRDRLALEKGKIAVFLVKDFCCHTYLPLLNKPTYVSLYLKAAARAAEIPLLTDRALRQSLSPDW